MAAGFLQPGAAPSLLDRLIDLDPESQREAPLSSWERARKFRAALRRDLTALLNTRRAAEDFDRRYEEATNSLLTFGILDFTSYNLKKAVEREQLRRSIEQAIRQFEPRLERVEVSIKQADPQKPLLGLQISAALRSEAGEPVVFEATVERDSRRSIAFPPEKS